MILWAANCILANRSTDQKDVLDSALAAAPAHDPHHQRTHARVTSGRADNSDGRPGPRTIWGERGSSAASLLVEQYGRIEVAAAASSTSAGQRGACRSRAPTGGTLERCHTDCSVDPCCLNLVPITDIGPSSAAEGERPANLPLREEVRRPRRQAQRNPGVRRLRPQASSRAVSRAGW